MNPEKPFLVTKWREVLKQEHYRDSVIGMPVDEVHLVKVIRGTLDYHML